MNSIRTKISWSLKVLLITTVLMIMSITSVFAASREFKYSKSGAILVLLDEETTYRENDTGGAKAFVPFSMSRSGDNMATLSKMTVLPGAQTGYGDWASSAALRFNAFNAYTGSGSQYLAKSGAVKTKANQGSTWIMPPYYSYNVDRRFVFRYAGMVVTGVNAMAGTNPIFPSDRIGSTSSAGSATPAKIYKRVIPETGGISWEEENITLYGTAGGVHSFEDIYTNGMNGTSVFNGSGNVVSNAATAVNKDPDTAQKAFKKWIDCDDGYGQAYAAKAADWKLAKNSPLEVWQILNQFFQIQGDPDKEDSTLYFYMVGGQTTKHTFYTTYSTTGEIINNVTPTFFGIKENESGEILAESYRNHTVMSKENGGPAEQTTGSVKLEVGKSYTLEGVLSYYNIDSASSKTSRSISLFVNSTGVTSDAADLSINMLPTSYLPDASAFNHVSPIDRKSSGTINASGNKTGDDEGTSYYYNGAAFITTGFTVTTELPQTGYLIIAVPDAFTENSDNDTMNDDRLAIRYTIVDTGDPPPPPGQAAFGDLNLGMPEYRDLHYIAQYEELPEEEEGGGEESGGGEGEEGAEPPEPIIITEERYSGYGYYKSATDAPQSGRTEDYEEKVENRRDIWNAGDVGDSEAITSGWWEYTDRIWPNQVDDLENKCWLTDANGSWDQDTEFLRSKSGENSFGFGFRVSRSRGDKGSVLSSAALEVAIYGVSPDTGDDGILLKEYTDGGTDFKTLRTGSIGVYQYSDVKYTGLVSCAAINGIENFPRIRVVAKISRDIHGESGICLSSSVYKEPAENSWEEEHDTVDRTFEAVMDDMRIVEVELKDSEGIVVYNANRYNTDYMNVEVDGYYDREEDLFMKVVLEQTIDSGHAVYEPTIDVSIRGVNSDGAEESTYIDQPFCLDGVSMGDGVYAVFNDIAFRPRGAHKLRINVEIDSKHGEDMWRENIWDNDDDAYGFTLEGTSADLALTQQIEVYNSKGSPQEFLTFAEYLSFKFDVRHIGRNARQTAVVGGSEINPYAKVNVKIYNADALSLDPVNGNIIYRMATQDPKAPAALIKSGDIQAATRLFPGLGTNDFASHVQAWYKNYIVQSYITDTDNVAAYGHILVTGNIDSFHDTNNTNIRNNSTDYVQQEFIGEKNFKIVDLGVSSRNSISDKTGLAIQIAAQNAASSYNNQTVVDKTYIDIYIDDERIKTIEVEIPIGDTVVTEAIIDDVDLEQCKVIEVRINTGKHQTHYEYVAKSTDSSLYPDPFIDNYMSIIVCPNKPNETICPLCVIDDNVGVDSVFGGNGGGNEGETPIVPDHDNVTDTSKYAVVFEANDGSTDNKTQEIEYNSSVNLLENTFLRTGYIFTGWNTKEDGSGTKYADKAVLSVGTKQSYGENTTLTLYAQWKVITYEIAFNSNGGTGTMENINCTFDVAQYLPANTFERSGYMFSGWNTRPDGSGISVDNGGSIKNFTDVQGKVVTLYAQWITDMDCIILENFVASSTVDLKAGDMIAENPSLMSMVDYSSYGYLMVKIPTVSAAKDGETIEQIYDLFSLDWNTADWTKVYERHGTFEGDQSVYVWRYGEILAPNNTTLNNPNSATRKANHTTDLYSRLTVGNFTALGTVHVSTELLGLVYAAPAGGSTPEEMAITDTIALQILGITE